MLCFPWLIGHALLYSFACGAATVRRRVRVALTIREGRRALGGATTDHTKMRELFEKFGTSGDGRVDATELKVALRAWTGVDLPLSDCNTIVRMPDTDASGTIEFSEFCGVLDVDFPSLDSSRALRASTRTPLA